MWQLETDATNASSGSTCAGFEYGAGTTEGEGDAGTMTPPSKVHVCSREYLPLRNSGLVRFQLMVALCSDIGEGLIRIGDRRLAIEDYLTGCGSRQTWLACASNS